MSFSSLDLIFIAIIGIFTIRCFLKGFVSELLSMAAIIFGILASLFLYKNGGELLRKLFWPDLEVIPEIVAFAALFLIVFILVKILEKMLTSIIEAISLGGADSFIGIIFGLAEGIAVVSLILFVMKIQPLFNPDELLSGSFFAQLLLPFITGKESVLSFTEVSDV